MIFNFRGTTIRLLKSSRRTHPLILEGSAAMSTELPATLINDAAETPAQAQSVISAWLVTAAAVVFTAAGVLFVSFVAVMSGMV
jgi:hypothetical protein